MKNRLEQVDDLSDRVESMIGSVAAELDLSQTNKDNISHLFAVALAHMVGCIDGHRDQLQRSNFGQDEDATVGLAMLKVFNEEFLNTVEPELKKSV